MQQGLRRSVPLNECNIMQLSRGSGLQQVVATAWGMQMQQQQQQQQV
jgi:hypothetical protein